MHHAVSRNSHHVLEHMHVGTFLDVHVDYVRVYITGGRHGTVCTCVARRKPADTNTHYPPFGKI